MYARGRGTLTGSVVPDSTTRTIPTPACVQATANHGRAKSVGTRARAGWRARTRIVRGGGRDRGCSRLHRWLLAASALVVLLPTLGASPRAEAAIGGATQFRLPSGRQLLDSWASPIGQLAVTDVSGSPQGSTLYVLDSGASLVFQRDFTGVVKDVTFSPSGDVYATETFLDGAGTGYVAQVHRMSSSGLQLSASEAFADSTSVDLEFGADGRVYAIIESNGGSDLVAFDPNQLDTLRRAELSQSVTWFHSRPDGLVHVNSAGLANYLDYTTLTESAYPYFNEPIGQSRRISVAPDTDVFELGLTFDPNRGEYPCDLGVATGRGRDGRSWQFETDGYFATATANCKLSDIEALPGGGAVISAIDGFHARIRWLDDDGTLTANFDYAATHGTVDWTEMSPRRSDMTVDGAGRVLLGVTVPDGPCPEGRFQQYDCSRLDVLGLLDGAQLFNVPTYGDTGNSDLEDDSAGLYETGDAQQQELRVVDGAVMLPLTEDGFYCGHACGGHYLSIASIAAEVKDRDWEDPPNAGPTQPPGNLGPDWTQPTPADGSTISVPSGGSVAVTARASDPESDGVTIALSFFEPDGDPRSQPANVVCRSNDEPVGAASVTCDIAAGGAFVVRIDAVDDRGAAAPGREITFERLSVAFAALGDSYSSGEGTYDYDEDGGRCHRGQAAWPRQMATDLAFTMVRHAACSGATTDEMLRPWRRRREPAQIPSVPEPSIDIVTFTMGGNDVGFAGILLDCFRSNCDEAENNSNYQVKLAELTERLATEIYPALIRAYPNARIVHVGYPRITPLRGETPINCAWLNPDEQDTAEQLTRQINGAIRAAVGRQTRIEYVDVTDALRSHELCTSESWMHPISVRRFNNNSEQGHPDATGQDAYAQAVIGALNLTSAT